jgi:hypothetical protein
MEFEHQKPVTDQYRDNWERTFGKVCICHKRYFCPDQDEAKCKFHQSMYPNGCPVIEESNA